MSRPIWQARRLNSAALREVYIKNGAFENVPPYTADTFAAGYWVNGTSGGDIRDNRYGWWQQGAGGSIKFDQATFFAGGASLCLYEKTTNADCVATNYPGGANVKGYCPELEPGASYYATFRMKTLYLDGATGAGNGAAVQACIRDSSGSLKLALTIAGQNITTSSATYITTTTDWTEYSGTFTVPAINSDITGATGTYGATLHYAPKLCIFNSTGSTKDLLMKAWFDNLRLYKVLS